jgi:hypothetical protein
VLQLRAKVADEGLHRGRGQVELGGDVDKETPLDKESAEHFVTALQQLGGCEKEAAAGVIVHGGSSGSRVTFGLVAQLRLQLRWTNAQRPNINEAVKGREKQRLKVSDRQM